MDNYRKKNCYKSVQSTYMKFIHVVYIIFGAGMWSHHFLAEEIYENTFRSSRYFEHSSAYRLST